MNRSQKKDGTSLANTFLIDKSNKALMMFVMLKYIFTTVSK